jgi:flavin reductase (DIM6/NTAB) family NADH-FMN oxidoreductase RutF
MAVNPDELRRVMRRWASGVCVVTSSDGDHHHGMTVTSFTSVSLEPPLILVSLENTTRTNAMVRQSGRFAVAILAADQQDLSDQFAGRLPDDDHRFADVPYFESELGSPIPEESLAFLDCKVTTNYEAATHTIFIGQVESSQIMREAAPLLYHDQEYGRLEGSNE